jgi:hypothetical protein
MLELTFNYTVAPIFIYFAPCPYLCDTVCSLLEPAMLYYFVLPNLGFVLPHVLTSSDQLLYGLSHVFYLGPDIYPEQFGCSTCRTKPIDLLVLTFACK